LFEDTGRALRRCGLTAEASALAQFYDSSFDEPALILRYVEALQTDLQPRETPAATEGALPLDGDGPLGPDAFIWEGKKYSGLSMIPWRLLFAIWNTRDRCLEINDTLGGEVWGDHALEPDDNAIGTARKACNTFFDEHPLPFRMQKRGNFVRIVDSPIDLVPEE
jgi:hypothetical protein